MTLDFRGQTAIVTGAAHGFGRAISLAFAARGADVWACDVLEGELHETEALCRAAGGSCHAVVADVRDRASVAACVSAASAGGGPRRHPGEQRRRRARTGGTAARADYAR